MANQFKIFDPDMKKLKYHLWIYIHLYSLRSSKDGSLDMGMHCFCFEWAWEDNVESIWFMLVMEGQSISGLM